MKRRKFLFNTALQTGAIGIMGLYPACKVPALSGVGQELKQATPESQGVSSGSIMNFLQAANACDFEWHSFKILRHGKIIAEGWWDPYQPANVHTLYSLSKSFTSTAVGFALAEGAFQLDDKVVGVFPSQVPADPGTQLSSMNIEHLLTMNTGHDTDSFATIRSKYFLPWIPTFFEHPVPFTPGTKFLYDTGATFMLSAIVQEKVGEPIDQFLRPRLFEPLGISNYDWQKSPEGVCAGGFGLRVNTDAIARFGQTYLDQGRWNGKQVIPEFWVNTATARHTDSNPGESEWSNGYGYQFWRCTLPGSYRGDGAYGQYCIVLPEQDMVVAVTSESWDMGKSMKIIFDHLVPGLSSGRLKEDPTKHMELKTLAAGLSLPVVHKNTTSIKSNHINQKTFRLLPNVFRAESFQLEFIDGTIVWKTAMVGRQIEIKAGMEKWMTTASELVVPFPVFFRTDHLSHIAATATWVDADTLQIDLKLIDGIHGDRMTFRFNGREVEIEMLNSVAAHEDNERNRETRPTLKGIML